MDLPQSTALLPSRYTPFPSYGVDPAAILLTLLIMRPSTRVAPVPVVAGTDNTWRGARVNRCREMSSDLYNSRGLGTEMKAANTRNIANNLIVQGEEGIVNCCEV